MDNSTRNIVIGIIVIVLIIAFFVFYSRRSSTTGELSPTTSEQFATTTEGYPESSTSNSSSDQSGEVSPAPTDTSFPADPPANQASQVQVFDMQAKNYTFLPKTLTVKAGLPVELKITSAQNHNFSIDELRVNQNLPAGKTTIVRFTPTVPGTYTFYCAPHRGEGMLGTLIVK